MKSAIFCAHANEVPVVCPCSDYCYCKQNTCREFDLEIKPGELVACPKCFAAYEVCDRCGGIGVIRGNRNLEGRNKMNKKTTAKAIKKPATKSTRKSK